MIPDEVLDHLRRVVVEPDLEGTRYEMRGLVGKGGMGEVYRVWDRLLEREAALKVVEDAEGMLAEAKTVAKLEHPGIVALYDAGVLADGRGFCVMRLVEGERLDAFVTSGRGRGERLEVALKLCDAVSFAHSQGVVHRDLKPQNVLLGRFGEVVVLDWGVALRVGNGEGEVVGTRRYMAPEQAAGAAVDSRADVYSLGVLLEDLLGEMSTKPLDAIAAKAKAELGERYVSVAEMSADLRRYQDRMPVSAYRESVWERGMRFVQRNQILLLLLGSYLFVRILLFFLRPR